MTGLLTPPRSPQAEPDSGQPAAGTPVRAVRRIVLGLVVGSLTMLGVATLDTVAKTEVPVLSTLASLPTGAADGAEAPAPPATPGTCLSWSRPDAGDTAVVDCGQPHLFEQAGPVSLADQVALPDDQQWRQLVSERCNPVVLSYLNGKFDPAGRYRVGALKPSPTMWADGDRELRCGLQSASRSGAMFPTVGRVADSDQSAVQQPGTCLGIDGRTVGDPVTCAGPHAVETVGVVDLAKKFTGNFPKVADQDGFLQPECTKVANAFAGGDDVIAKKKLTVYWDNVGEDSWKAGSRKVNCNLAALLADRSGFAAVTGSVTGDVKIGDGTSAPADDAAGTDPAPVAPADRASAPAAAPQPTTKAADQDATDDDADDPATDDPSPSPSAAPSGGQPVPPVPGGPLPSGLPTPSVDPRAAVGG